MDCPHRHKFFAALFVSIFFGAMWVCTNWVMDITTYASIPVIMCAETIILGMFYATIFHGAPADAQHEAVGAPRRDATVRRSEQLLQIGTLKNRSA